tara:strand:- start:29747 stop:30070 length:324 start_codon:yes stop_codon:yes gene_type:complete
MEANNKLIAEFMGLDAQIRTTNNVHSWNDAPFYYITKDSKEKVMEGISKYSKYHTSWDWLMPVLKKINLQLNPDNYNEWRMINKPTEYNIENVHAQVVEFIKEYMYI